MGAGGLEGRIHLYCKSYILTSINVNVLNNLVEGCGTFPHYEFTGKVPNLHFLPKPHPYDLIFTFHFFLPV